MKLQQFWSSMSNGTTKFRKKNWICNCWSKFSNIYSNAWICFKFSIKYLVNVNEFTPSEVNFTPTWFRDKEKGNFFGMNTQICLKWECKWQHEIYKCDRINWNEWEIETKTNRKIRTKSARISITALERKTTYYIQFVYIV